MMNALRLSVALALAAPAAFASGNFPDAMKTHLTLSTVPACGVCHTSGNAGGNGTVNTPFGASMKQQGATGSGNTTALNSALDKLAAAKTDSDGDGVGDIAELKAGTDPNVAQGGADGGTAPAPTPPATYGCGANAIPELLTGAGVLALLALTRRRAR